MSPINVLVATTSRDMQAAVVFEALSHRSDIAFVTGEVVTTEKIDGFLGEMPRSAPCALVLVGPHHDTEKVSAHWLKERKDLVVLRVWIDDLVSIAVRDAGIDALLAALRELVNRAGGSTRERVSQIQLRAIPAHSGDQLRGAAADRPLLNAAVTWVHVLLRAAVARLVESRPGQGSVSVTSASVADFLEARDPQTAMLGVRDDVDAANEALSRALAATDATKDPLAIAAQALGLSALELRIVLLALGPELDPRHQRWITLLMDDIGRRVGTLGLYMELLGEPSLIGRELALSGNLMRWCLLETSARATPSADEPLRLDPPVRAWLLGAENALGDDLRLRRVIRAATWPGASLLDDDDGRRLAAGLIGRLRRETGPNWIVLANANPAALRAHIEAGAADLHLLPIRVELVRLQGLDLYEIEDAGIRLVRMALLTGRPVIVDSSNVDDGREQDDQIRAFLSAAGSAGRPCAVIAENPARIIRLLGSASYEIESEVPLAATRMTALRNAAAGAGASITQEAAEAISNLYPLQIDGFEQAMRLACATPHTHGGDEAKRDRFLSACKEVSAEKSSGLAQRIEPIFDLADVVLPPDRKRQLEEIVDNIRFAPHVLDGWRFRDQLPYGRGVAALFHGPSGTGKTMAAMAIARQLGVQILRIDLSRVVSKYIGETEKNIDRVFLDAQLSGAALLIDEADGLLAKRTEVSDAHDRYANIEVAYLLQRMEAYEGLAILTTNFRQNLDAALLRRLRFIIDFPRPDAAAREEIWRRCLPEESHILDDAAFRQLARKIELTGGHVRQITLRAAFVAAAAGSKIRAEHIAYACRVEFAKLGVPPIEVDLVESRRAA